MLDMENAEDIVLDEDTKALVRRLSKTWNRPASEIVRDAVLRQIDDEQLLAERLSEANRQVEEGKCFTFADVKAEAMVLLS